MEGSSIALMKKVKRDHDPDDMLVEEYTVADVPLNGDAIQHEIEDDDVEEEDGINMQYEIEDHQYISQAEGLQKLKEARQTNTKYIICSPNEHIVSETYKASWTRGMTQILIEEYRNMVDDFRNPHKKQKDLWYELANNMCQRGCDVTWDMCDRKWRNLKHTFKTIYYNHHRSSKSKRHWEFYNDLEELFLTKGNDEGLRKSRTIKPISTILEDQKSVPSGTSTLGLTARPLKIPRLNAPQVSYAQMLDVSNLQNQIVSCPQIVLCDENGIPMNKKPSGITTSVPVNKIVTDETEEDEETPPSWFIEFMKQYRLDEEHRLALLKEMHAEVIQLEKRKCVALENIVKKFVQ